MEKLTYAGIVSSWEAFLKENPKNYIRIENKDTGVFYTDTSKKQPSMFTLLDIEGTNGNVSKWLDGVIKGQNLKNAKVVFRKKSGGNGSMPHPKFNDTDYNFSNRLEALNANMISMENTPQAPVDNQTPVNNVFGTAPQPPQIPHMAPNLPASNAYHPQTPYGGLGQAAMQSYGGLGQAALAAGMAMPEFVNLLKKADKVDDLKEEIDRYKAEINKHKDENHALVIKNRDLDSKVSNAAQQQEIAVKLAQLEKKGFLDSEAAQRMLESLPILLQTMSGGGQSQAPQAALGMPAGMSEDKQRFIGYITDDMCTREMVQILEETLMRLANIPAYKIDLKQLNLKEYGTAPSGNG